ncbi:MAG: hypothetical protein ACYC8T_27040 [Myxococcaceae bacterium]
MSRWTVIACLLLPVFAGAEPMVFLRVDQAGGLERGNVAASYSVEAARAVIAIEGSGDRGDAYLGAVHRLTAAYGILDWLSLGVEQSLKQPASDQLRIGMLAPELRVRLDRLGLPIEGLGTYLQGRVRVTARRPSSLVGGLVYDRELGSLCLGARLGFESTVGAVVPELGFRSELGIAWRLGDSWRLSAEAWGTTGLDELSETDYHAGPSVQYRWKALRVGTQLGMGVKSRTRLLIFDSVVMARVAVGF